MRTLNSIALLSLVTGFGACGDDGGSKKSVDPRVIPGGGIGDGEIDGVVNLYVIDDDTREPIANASVKVGEYEGMTDADGLFVAKEPDIVGPQTVLVKVSGYTSVMWVGANGANMTVNVEKPTAPTPESGTISGSVDLSGVTVPAGHFKAALVTYVQTDDLGDKANEIMTAAKANICGVAATTPPQTCNWSVTTRVGDISLLALIVDGDPMGPGDADDVITVIGYGYAGKKTVTAGGTVSGATIDVLATSDVATETVDFGTPPSGLEQHLAIIGVETPEGVFQIQLPASAQSPSVKVPKLSAVGGTGYRMTGIAQNTATPPTQAIVIRRGQTGATLNAGTWTSPPTNVTLTRTHAQFTATAGASVHSVEYTSGESKLLGITLFDNSASVDIPELVALPAGTVEAKVNAIFGEGLDVMNLELDRDKNKLSAVGATPAQVPN